MEDVIRSSSFSLAIECGRPVPSTTMQTRVTSTEIDIAMVGTFAAWRLGTLQARALPFARELGKRGVRCAIVTVPWDMPTEAGVSDVIGGVSIYNTRSSGVATFPLAVGMQVRMLDRLKPRVVHVFKPNRASSTSSSQRGTAA
jgi:hypothetical protein